MERIRRLGRDKKVMIVAIVLVLALACGGIVSFAGWGVNESYSVGDTVDYNGTTYRCVIAHTVYDENWSPENAPALWQPVDGGKQVTPVTPVTPQDSDDKDTSDEVVTPTDNDNSDTVVPSDNDNTDEAVTPSDNNTDEAVTPSGDFPDKVFSPYADMSLYVGTWGDHSFNLADCMKQTGQKFYTMAFILSSNGKPAWGGSELVADGSDDLYMKRINDLRAQGGDVMVSFGGANGTELAQAITDVNELVKAYQLVIDRYQLKWIDLDIEGGAVADSASIDRRNKAIKIIQANNPNLTVAYCLPALPTGLTNEGVNVIKNAKSNGVRVDVVNIMAMDYGDGAASNPEGRMGDYAIEAAKNTHTQVTSAGLNSKIGVTPMIGVNDVRTEVFRISDASKLVSWAASTDYVRLLSMWSVTRDNGDAGVLDYAVCNSSSIQQSKFDFVKTFKAFNK